MNDKSKNVFEKYVLGYEEVGYTTVEAQLQDGSLYYVRDFPRKCIYCDSGLQMHGYTSHSELIMCKSCGWWFGASSEGRTGWSVKDISAYYGMLKKYELDSKDIPLNLIKEHILKYPVDICNMNPHRFEKLICDVFKDYYAPCEVVHIGEGGGKDRGIDLKLILSDNQTYLVQIKRRKNIEKKETVKFVRELNGVLFREGIPRGIFVTTANDYTKDAISEVKQAEQNNISYDMKLLAFNDLINMLNIIPSSPYEPWKKHLPYEYE